MGEEDNSSAAISLVNAVDHFHRLAIEYRAISDLVPAKRNARTHNRKQIRQIADSIKTFGFVNPILIDAIGNVIAGHGRLAAATLLGLRSVPAISIERMTEAQRRAYAIADNRLAELAGWDNELLKVELGELSIAFPELDLTITGFDTAELDTIILGDAAGAIASDPKGDQLPTNTGPRVSRLGDLWLLGPHRVLCADARLADSYPRLLGGQQAGMALTDPPYNVGIAGHARGLGRHQHPDFVMASGELNEAEFIAFLEAAFAQMATVSVPGAVHVSFMDWAHLYEALTAGRRVYDALLNICVWAKANAGMGGLYRSQHEIALIWRVRGGKHLNNIELGRHGRNRSNVWSYAGANSFGPERAEMLALHPTVKPVAMLADAILDVSKRGDLVLDPFLGSGSTIIAAHKVDRMAAGMELDPRYVDVAVRRFEQVTGITVRHAATGRTFTEEVEHRAGEVDVAQSEESKTKVDEVAR